MLEIFSEIIFASGLTLGVGSSTFALIFYIRALEDGVVDASEKRFMNVVYVVLRIGMALIVMGLLLSLGTTTPHPFAHWFLFGVITINAVLMHYRVMPMKFGPVIAGGSWYSLFFVAKTPLGEWGSVALLPLYVLFLAGVYGIFYVLKNRFTAVKGAYGGDVMSDSTTLERYSTDASSFKIAPQAVYYPRNVSDIVELTKMCRIARATDPLASLTLRAGGTCMSGGPLNTGWIVDMTKYMHTIEIDPEAQTATVEMGAYFRDIEDQAQKYGLMFAAYPSSHRVCGIGGMLGNNASGEKSLRCGATSDNVLELEVVLADGSIERIHSKSVAELSTESEKKLNALYRTYGEKMRTATGNVKKSASGYRFEKVVNGDTFNAVPLFVGAQGTLGIITKAVLKLTPLPTYTELLLISASSLKNIPEIIDVIHQHNPEGIETFDRNTFAKAREHLTEHAERIAKYIAPKSHLVILAQFSEETEAATVAQAQACLKELTARGHSAVHVTERTDVQAAWEVRRHSFLLMRDYNEKGLRAVPCIEDVIVPLDALGTFITSLRAILKKRAINYGYHGHIGDGSLRVIPVFDFTKPKVGEEIAALMDEVFALVKRLKGNISADHSDGIIRTPFLKEFYGEELYGVFGEIKHLFDPENIMNPNKKIGGSVGLLNRCLDCEKV